MLRKLFFLGVISVVLGTKNPSARKSTTLSKLILLSGIVPLDGVAKATTTLSGPGATRFEAIGNESVVAIPESVDAASEYSIEGELDGSASASGTTTHIEQVDVHPPNLRGSTDQGVAMAKEADLNVYTGTYSDMNEFAASPTCTGMKKYRGKVDKSRIKSKQFLFGKQFECTRHVGPDSYVTFTPVHAGSGECWVYSTSADGGVDFSQSLLDTDEYSFTIAFCEPLIVPVCERKFGAKSMPIKAYSNVAIKANTPPPHRRIDGIPESQCLAQCVADRTADAKDYFYSYSPGLGCGIYEPLPEFDEVAYYEGAVTPPFSLDEVGYNEGAVTAVPCPFKVYGDRQSAFPGPIRHVTGITLSQCLDERAHDPTLGGQNYFYSYNSAEKICQVFAPPFHADYLYYEKGTALFVPREA